MLKNYFQTGLRFLKQNKLFAGINLFGLSIALAASFIILLYVINELSYDHCHKNRRSVYRILNLYTDTKRSTTFTPFVLASTLREDFPQIEKAIRTMPMPITLKNESGTFSEIAISTDSEVFDIFTLSLIGGQSSNSILEDKSSIVISHEIADKMFGEISPIGKSIMGTISGSDYLFIIKGVFENIPENSTFSAKCFINSKWSADNVGKILNVKDISTSWIQDMWVTWVKLSKGTNIKLMEKQIESFKKKDVEGHPSNVYSLQNLSKIYLGSDEIRGSQIRGNVNNVRIFSTIAFLIIVVAAFNYIILSTSISTARTKEIGLRKTFGAGVNSIRGQFLTEALILVMVALPVALVLMLLMLPFAGQFIQTNLHLIKSNGPIYATSYVLLVIIIGLSSGFYTSGYLSKLNVVEIINKSFFKGNSRHFIRLALSVIQLILFCSFMAGALIIRSQYNYVIKKDLGYYNKDILLIDLGSNFKGYTAFLNIIKSFPNVIMAAGTDVSFPLNRGITSMVCPNFQNKDIQVPVGILGVDFNFLKTIGLSLIEGRDFSEEYGGDINNSTILNETAIKQLDIIDPVGKKFINSTIIGVVKDFNLFSLRTDITPIAVNVFDGSKRQIAIHYKQGTFNSLLPALKNEWIKLTPDQPFRYKTIEGIIEDLYKEEKNLATTVSFFAFLILIISASGLFGLTLFLAKSRTKETGIKKVLGSSEQAIVFSFLLENFILVSLAALISVPVAFHFGTQWLSKYAFKTSIGWWIFLLSYITATVVVLSTVFYHSYKVSRINPVKALRYNG
jgi:putative ABC transport system permease protein